MEPAVMEEYKMTATYEWLADPGNRVDIRRFAMDNCVEFGLIMRGRPSDGIVYWQ